MDFWGGPLWDGTALLDILPLQERMAKNFFLRLGSSPVLLFGA